MFLFVFKNGVIKVLRFFPLKGFDDGVLFVTDGHFDQGVFTDAADKDVDARRVSAKIFDGVIIRALD